MAETYVRNYVDMTGMRFMRLVVEKRVGRDKFNKALFRCRCDCGNTIVCTGASLRSGHTKSCGCLHNEAAKQRATKHGLGKTRLYTIWLGMKNRCYVKSNMHYREYGGSGIKVYSKWKNDFKEFYVWALNNGYEDGLTLDRINNKKGYYPNNCRWVTQQKQNWNKKNNIIVEYNGKEWALPYLCDEYGFNCDLARSRHKCGWPDEFLFMPKGFSYKKYLKEKERARQQEAIAS